MPWKHIPNESLKVEQVPPDNADWSEIQTFALTYDGYTEFGSVAVIGKLANKRCPSTLTEYRACLFFEQRRWRHFAEEPDPESLTYIRRLVAGIRQHLQETPT